MMPGLRCIPYSMVTTRRLVPRLRMSASMLTCAGARCCTTTNAMRSALRRWVRASTASSPPADAPMPATGNCKRGGPDRGLAGALESDAPDGAPGEASPLGLAGGGELAMGAPRSRVEARQRYANGGGRFAHNEPSAAPIDDSCGCGRSNRPARGQARFLWSDDLDQGFAPLHPNADVHVVLPGGPFEGALEQKLEGS